MRRMADTPPHASQDPAFVRLETFVDSAFAFALTLLVISFDEIPENFDALVQSLLAVPAFLATFVLLMTFWFTHRHWSARYGVSTLPAALLSMALVFVILVYVYPLRGLMSATLHSLSNGLFPTRFHIESLDEARGLFIVYGIGFLVSNLCLASLFLYSARWQTARTFSDRERMNAMGDAYAWLIVGAMGAVSAMIATFANDNTMKFAGWSYASLAVIMPLYGIAYDRHIERRLASPAETGAPDDPDQ